MARKKLVMRFQRPEQVGYINFDRWRVQPRGRWSWAQRAAWWFLKRTHAASNAVETKIEYREMVIDSEKVSETIFRAMEEMQLLHIRPVEVLLGPEQFDELGYDIMKSAPFSFEVPLGYDREIFGLKVTVVPWMSGVLVLPGRRV